MKLPSLLKEFLKYGIYTCKLPFSHDIIKSTELIPSRSQLNDFSPCPAGTSKANNEIKDPKYDLQIIVPAYNVEKYVDECIKSILSQDTEYKYLLVLVDDGSTDATSRIIDQYANSDNVKIIHQTNKGFSGARNAGLKEIFARYVMFVDSDDLLPQGAIQIMISAIKDKKADIVQGGFYGLNGKKRSTYYNSRYNKFVSAPLELKARIVK